MQVADQPTFDPLRQRLAGKKAVVTGAARGIGLAIAERMVAEGASVLMVDRDAEIEGAATALDQPGLRLDLLEPGAVSRLFDHVGSEFGSLDILVNNAGFTRSVDFLDLSLEDYDAVMAINATVPMLATQAAARLMIAAGIRGSIVNMSSVSGTLGVANQVAYGMAKGAVRQLTVSASVALAAHGIRVNAIAPGTIETDLLKAVVTDEVRRKVMQRTPLGRFGTPHEIAAATVFLASDDASYMTGQTIFVDGGRLSLNLTVEDR